jgi:ribosome maturation factor RimP
MTETIDIIKELLEPMLEGTDMFLVSLKIKPTNNIKVFLDSDSSLSVERIAKINRGLRHSIEEKGLYPDGDFSLEVSSPGIDEPLHFFRQYKKNIGRTVCATLNDLTDKTGILKEASEDGIIIEMKVPRKKETTMIVIPFSDIKKTVVQIVF